MESSAIRAYEIFKELNLSPETAKEMAEIVTTSRDEHLEKWVANKDDIFAVKEDLARVESSLREDIAGLDVKIASVRTELKEDILKMENSLDMKIASVRTELKEEIASLREGIVRMEARLETSFAKAQSSTNRWLIGIAIALSGVIIAVAKGVLG